MSSGFESTQSTRRGNSLGIWGLFLSCFLWQLHPLGGPGGPSPGLLRVCEPQDFHRNLNVWGGHIPGGGSDSQGEPPKVKTPLPAPSALFYEGSVGPVAQGGVEPHPLSASERAGPAVDGSERVVPAPGAWSHAEGLRGTGNSPPKVSEGHRHCAWPPGAV